LAGLLAVSDLDFTDKEKYLAHARERCEVWMKGYALLGDVDGVLYVYAKTQDDAPKISKKLLRVQKKSC
jgi:hypothetical protein